MKLFSGKPSPEALLSELRAAYDLIQKNRLSEALTLLNKIVKQVPNNAKALELRGQVNGMLGNITEALADVKKSVELKPTAAGYFNYALAHLHSQNNKAGFYAILRTLQLEPNDPEAWSLREQLAKNLGLVDLDLVARDVERFMYSLCGPGIGWIVELRHMYRFSPAGKQEEYNAVVLDLCQQPPAFIQIQTTPPEYKIIINSEKYFPSTSQHTFIDAIIKIIPANNAALLDVLNDFIKDGVLIKENECLRFTG